MCGRFTLTVDARQIRETFPWLKIPEDIQPRYNIAPSQPVAVVPNDGRQELDFFVWGLIPSWAKDPTIGNRLINARAETLAEKPSFRSAFRRRRCLVLSNGFYEWKSEAGRKVKTPFYIKLHDDQPFAFAGLWESWQAPDGSNILSCTIITTQPNELLREIHNRMPVILPKSEYALWLDTGEPDQKALQEILRPYPASQMITHPVSTTVNNPANETPECILPV